MKIWQLHTVNLIGLIFGYSAAPIVFHVPIKFQLPTSLTFSVIGDRANSTFDRPKKVIFAVFKQDSDFLENLHTTQAGSAIDEF